MSRGKVSLCAHCAEVRFTPGQRVMLAVTDTGSDLMLTDVGLAGKSGVDLAMDVCGERPDLRVIFLTGCDLVLTPEQRKVLPHAILLRKPYEVLDLIDAVTSPLS